MEIWDNYRVVGLGGEEEGLVSTVRKIDFGGGGAMVCLYYIFSVARM